MTICWSFLDWNSSLSGADCAARSFCAARGFRPRCLFAASRPSAASSIFCRRASYAPGSSTSYLPEERQHPIPDREARFRARRPRARASHTEGSFRQFASFREEHGVFSCVSVSVRGLRCASEAKSTRRARDASKSLLELLERLMV